MRCYHSSSRARYRSRRAPSVAAPMVSASRTATSRAATPTSSYALLHEPASPRVIQKGWTPRPGRGLYIGLAEPHGDLLWDHSGLITWLMELRPGYVESMRMRVPRRVRAGPCKVAAPAYRKSTHLRPNTHVNEVRAPPQY